MRTPELLVALYGATPEQVDRLGNDFGQNIYQSQEAKSQAVFGQFDYDITERLEISLGLRYSKDEKDFFARLAVNWIPGRSHSFFGGLGVSVAALA